MAHTIEEFTATCKSAWGTPCPKFEYPFKAKVYATWADAMAAGDGYSDDELLVKKNADNKNSASAVERDRLLVGMGYEKPTSENNVYMRLKAMYIPLRQSGKTHDEAVKIAAMNVGEDWDPVPADGSIKFRKGK